MVEPTGMPLARRLRDLRVSGFPQLKLTQRQLAAALSEDEPLADSTLSSWESTKSSAVPTNSRLRAYARFFATKRSLEGGRPHLVPAEELTQAEQLVRDELERELFLLRDGETIAPDTGQFWRFDDGTPITLICSDLKLSDELELGPLAEQDNPNFADLYSYGDLDALFELYGHLRATNPDTPVNLRRGTTATSASPSAVDLVNHLVVLGGIAWNDVTRRLNDLLELPVRQIKDAKTPSGEIFVADGPPYDGERFEPRWIDDNPGEPGAPGVLIEDVGMLARLPNPYNTARTLTYCNGIHSRGVLGAVRALTDPAVRADNEQYLAKAFSGSDSFVILMRVPVLGGQTLSPTLQSPGTVRFQWGRRPTEN